MTESNCQQSIVQQLLPRTVMGDRAAIDAVLRHTCDRLTSLTRRMLGDFQRSPLGGDRRCAPECHAAPGDGAADVKPVTARDFLALAALQIRRELIDLARRFYGPEGIRRQPGEQGPEDSQTPGPSTRAISRHEPAHWPSGLSFISRSASPGRRARGGRLAVLPGPVPGRGGGGAEHIRAHRAATVAHGSV